MQTNETLGAVTHTHTQDNLIKNKKHKDMMYLCNFVISKII